jgi:DNA-binding LytR/AlgR family response regulator
VEKHINIGRGIIMKPTKEKVIIESLKDAIGELINNDKILVECINGKISFIRISDILYIEYIDRITIIRTDDTTYETRLSLKQ